MASPHVVLRGVSHSYSRKGQPDLMALSGIDLELEKGEFFSVVGPSGCGKSTLIEIMSGLSRPTRGVVEFEGKRIEGQVPLGVGLVFQENACLPWLNVRDNVAFGLEQSQLSRAEIDERVSRAITLMGLNEFTRAFPSQLSGGMRQRVCIARTLILRPRFILLDEPFGALDQQTRRLMGDELLKLWRESRATVLLITHSLDEAAMLSDRVGVMSARPGRLLEVVRTNWPAERDSHVIGHPQFAEITNHIWTRLRSESEKSVQGSVAAA